MTGRRRRERRSERRSGFAIADFIAGMLILAGALTAFATMTRSKFDALAQSDQLARGVAAAEEAIDRVRTGGLPRAPFGEADVDGFRAVATFTPTAPGLLEAQGRIEARALRVGGGGNMHGLFEARVVVTWRDGPARRAAVRLSTIATVPQ